MSRHRQPYYNSKWEDQPYRRTSGRASPTYNDPVELPTATMQQQQQEQQERSPSPPPVLYSPPPSQYDGHRVAVDAFDNRERRRNNREYGDSFSSDRHEGYYREREDHHRRRRPMSYGGDHDDSEAPRYMNHRMREERDDRRRRDEYDPYPPHDRYARRGGGSVDDGWHRSSPPYVDRYKGGRRSRSNSREGRYERDFDRRDRRYDRNDRMDRHERERDAAVEEEEEEELDELQVYQNLMTAIGDNGPQAYEKHLHGLVKNMDESDMETYEAELVETIIECASQLPHKTPVYGTLAALLNKRFPKSFGSRLSEAVVKDLESVLNAGDITRAKMILRFIAGMCAAQMISCDDWLQLVETILAMANASTDRYLADCYTYSVLGALPWMAPTLSIFDSEKLGTLIANLGHLTRSSDDVDSTRLMSLSVQQINRRMFEQMRDAHESNHWSIACIPHTHTLFEQQLAEQKKHVLGKMTLREITTLVAFVRADFDIDNISTNRMAGVDQLCVLEMCSDILFFFGSDISLCGKTLYHLVEYFGPMYKSRNQSAVDHLVVQSICAHLFMQPISPSKSIFYSLLIIRLLPDHDDISAELVTTINWLLENAHRLDAETRERVSELFAFQMNYFQFAWDWDALEEVVTLDESDVKRIFLQQCLHKIEYLSFIHPMANEAFGTFREKLIGVERHPFYRYEKQVAHSEITNQLITLFQQRRATESSIERLLSQISLSEEDGENERITMLLQVFMRYTFMGNLGVYHIDRIAVDNVLRKMITKDDIARQKVAISAIHEFWQRNPQKQMLTVHNLHINGILTAASIVEWVTDQPKTELHKGHLWTMVHDAIDKVVHLLQTTHGDLVAKQKQLATTTKKDATDDNLVASSPEDMGTTTSFMGSADTLQREQSDHKKAELEKDIEQLKQTFDAHAKELDDAFAVLLHRLHHLLNQDNTGDMSDGDEEGKVSIWIETTKDHLSQILNQYRKLMKRETLESVPSSDWMRSMLERSLYWQRCETLSHISTLQTLQLTTHRDTLLVESLQ